MPHSNAVKLVYSVGYRASDIGSSFPLDDIFLLLEEKEGTPLPSTADHAC